MGTLPTTTMLLLLLPCCSSSVQTTNRQRLYQHVLSLSSSSIRPVVNESSVVQVNITFYLQGVVCVYDQLSIVRVSASIMYRWFDELRTWDQTQYGASAAQSPEDIRQNIMLSSTETWVPPILMLNSAKRPWDDDVENSDVGIMSDGLSWRTQPIIIDALCGLDLRSFPFDEQNCIFMFESFTYHIGQMDLDFNATTRAGVSSAPSGEPSTLPASESFETSAMGSLLGG
jgi:hypothetical protein